MAGRSVRRAAVLGHIVKHGAGTRFVVLDAAMNDLLRPAMYDTWHGIVPVSAADAVLPTSLASAVGPVRESGDTFSRSRCLPPLQPNANVAILDAGAYVAAMPNVIRTRTANLAVTPPLMLGSRCQCSSEFPNTDMVR
jgi:diaminopimelate decarboxylase